MCQIVSSALSSSCVFLKLQIRGSCSWLSSSLAKETQTAAAAGFSQQVSLFSISSPVSLKFTVYSVNFVLFVSTSNIKRSFPTHTKVFIDAGLGNTSGSLKTVYILLLWCSDKMFLYHLPLQMWNFVDLIVSDPDTNVLYPVWIVLQVKALTRIRTHCVTLSCFTAAVSTVASKNTQTNLGASGTTARLSTLFFCCCRFLSSRPAWRLSFIIIVSVTFEHLNASLRSKKLQVCFEMIRHSRTHQSRAFILKKKMMLLFRFYLLLNHL